MINKNLTISLQFIALFCFLMSCSKQTGNVQSTVSNTPSQTAAPTDFTVVEYASVALNKTNKVPIFVHYMPWFESPEFAQFGNTDYGKWGMHWTMSNRNPNIIDSLGHRQIASYFYPLIGPYDNGEPDYLEYAVSIMKLSGLDGVMIDYPGNTNVNDAKMMLRHTDAFIPWLIKAGLKFSIVYEDIVLKIALDQKVTTNMITEGKSVLSYMNQNYFSKDNYFKIGNQPVLLNFGPQAILTDQAWNEIFSGVTPKPLFITLPYRIQAHSLLTSAAGEFPWGSSALTEDFYQHASQYKVIIGGALPGFKDYYLAGGWGTGYGAVDYLNGDRFIQSLQFTNTHRLDAIQIMTWNDFGEGTVVEPTAEFGYKYLNQIQSFAGVSNPTSDLAIAVDLYAKRKKNKGDTIANKKLDQVFYYIISLQLDKARTLLNSI